MSDVFLATKVGLRQIKHENMEAKGTSQTPTQHSRLHPHSRWFNCREPESVSLASTCDLKVKSFCLLTSSLTCPLKRVISQTPLCLHWFFFSFLLCLEMTHSDSLSSGCLHVRNFYLHSYDFSLLAYPSCWNALVGVCVPSFLKSFQKYGDHMGRRHLKSITQTLQYEQHEIKIRANRVTYSKPINKLLLPRVNITRILRWVWLRGAALSR